MGEVCDTQGRGGGTVNLSSVIIIAPRLCLRHNDVVMNHVMITRAIFVITHHRDEGSITQSYLEQD